ncbi:helix-turn-helix transcriptional regulator [Fictibacillus nanhaiensis]|uniref:helix-turn-helix domain-containing protein n=1 Tax=Fictibacillus nanhaiensis TaxID=742169 RepID=UPI001C9687B7|nr:helix-turn-helix transcriptional regulator [Fictibacillus nanhaiensis]MBY6037577.1 helix-turn-helix transcriptional regulator [Fictibacillus nanhaiensis]
MNVKIKELRKKNGDTLKSLAKKINYDYSNLSKIERGVYSPSLSLLVKIAEVYSVNLMTLLDVNEPFTLEEESLMKELDFSSDELLEEYDLCLDGKKVTKHEFDFIIQTLRMLRDTIQNK